MLIHPPLQVGERAPGPQLAARVGAAHVDAGVGRAHHLRGGIDSAGRQVGGHELSSSGSRGLQRALPAGLLAMHLILANYMHQCPCSCQMPAPAPNGCARQLVTCTSSTVGPR